MRVFCFAFVHSYFPFVTLLHFGDACLVNMETHSLQQGITLKPFFCANKDALYYLFTLSVPTLYERM